MGRAMTSHGNDLIIRAAKEPIRSRAAPVFYLNNNFTTKTVTKRNLEGPKATMYGKNHTNVTTIFIPSCLLKPLRAKESKFFVHQNFFVYVYSQRCFEALNVFTKVQ